MEIDPPSDDVDDGVGLGYGDVGLQATDKGKAMGRDEAIVTSVGGASSETSPVLPSSGHDGEGDDDKTAERTFPDDEELKKMRTRLEELQGEADPTWTGKDRSELIGMVRLNILP